jgi:predicted house-cleaning NTP pyrophosphatase (Maf/HAM1 superfamily)
MAQADPGHSAKTSTPQLAPLLTEEESARNADAKERLKSVLKRGEALLVIGAGTSVPVGHRSWEKPLKKIEALALGLRVDGLTTYLRKGWCCVARRRWRSI